MYKEQALERIRNINWNLIETVERDELGNLGYEFLRRMAKFYEQTGIRPITPVFTNIARMLGDSNEINLDDYASEEMKKVIHTNLGIKYICMHYLQLAQYADEHHNVAQYLSVYEPMIRLLEVGGSFLHSVIGIEIYGGGYFGLNGWYNRFLNAKPKDISNI